jgi:hypothetical protein
LCILLGVLGASWVRAQEVSVASVDSSPAFAPAVRRVDRSGLAPGGAEAFGGAFSILFANDFFSGNDNRYTAGFASVWTSAAVETYSTRSLYPRIVKAFSFLPTVWKSGYRNYLQFVVGMEMYTAGDIAVPDPPPGEHPYAGLVHLDSSIMSMNPVSSHQFTLRLGWVGPASGAQEVQSWFHKTFGSPDPQGWNTQLSNEPIVNLFYQYGRRLVRKDGCRPLGFDLTANGGGGFGNYYIGANIGLMARAGYRLPDTYGVTPIFGEAESIVGLTPPRKNIFCYAFLESQGFGVLRWLPMDGNTFTEVRSMERNYWVANLSLGLVAGYGRVVLAYTYHGVTGLTGLGTAPGRNQDSFGTIMFTVFLD